MCGQKMESRCFQAHFAKTYGNKIDFVSFVKMLSIEKTG